MKFSYQKLVLENSQHAVSKHYPMQKLTFVQGSVSPVWVLLLLLLVAGGH